jgi:hypothetical protein
MRFWYPFFISFDKYKVRNRAVSGLFFILGTISYLSNEIAKRTPKSHETISLS